MNFLCPYTGILTDYMIWFVAVTALVLVIVGVLS